MPFRAPMLGALALAVACGDAGPEDPGNGEGTPLALSTGSHEFTFRDSRGNADRPILVRYHMPEPFTPTTPIVFVMHGASRAGAGYFSAWEPEAEAHGFLLVVPEFGDLDYPGSVWYNLGNVFPTEEPTTPNQEEEWTFTAIEHLFDTLQVATGTDEETFRIYGHSAGSQFVHRFLMLRTEAPVDRAVLANAGWYTLPVDSARWPYGFGDSGFQASQLSTRFALPVTVLLGDQDIDETSSSLRRTPEALAQGPHRFARGHTFYQVAADQAAALGAAFAWQLDTVPGAHHSNALMTPAAAAILLQPLSQ